MWTSKGRNAFQFGLPLPSPGPLPAASCFRNRGRRKGGFTRAELPDALGHHPRVPSKRPRSAGTAGPRCPRVGLQAVRLGGPRALRSECSSRYCLRGSASAPAGKAGSGQVPAPRGPSAWEAAASRPHWVSPGLPGAPPSAPLWAWPGHLAHLRQRQEARTLTRGSSWRPGLADQAVEPCLPPPGTGRSGPPAARPASGTLACAGRARRPLPARTRVQ